MSAIDIIDVPATLGFIGIVALALIAVCDVFRAKRSSGRDSRHVKRAHARFGADI